MEYQNAGRRLLELYKKEWNNYFEEQERKILRNKLERNNSWARGNISRFKDVQVFYYVDYTYLFNIEDLHYALWEKLINKIKETERELRANVNMEVPPFLTRLMINPDVRGIEKEEIGAEYKRNDSTGKFFYRYQVEVGLCVWREPRSDWLRFDIIT